MYYISFKLKILYHNIYNIYFFTDKLTLFFTDKLTLFFTDKLTLFFTDKLTLVILSLLMLSHKFPC
jgi:hypothetical protein